MESDSAYCRRRASEERVAAIRADGPEAARAHRELASRFAEMAKSIDLANATFTRDDGPVQPFLTLSV